MQQTENTKYGKKIYQKCRNKGDDLAMKHSAGLFFTLAMLVTLTGVAWVPAHAQAVNEALAVLEQEQFAGDRFSFCVLGDNQVPSGLSEIFVQGIKEMNLLDSSFIIEVGDLIPGVAGDTAGIHREWDTFLGATSASRVPFIPVVGNHDVEGGWDYLHIYKQRIGPLAFSFDYGNSHFLCLSTEEFGQRGNIGPAQLRWLKEDIAAHQKATNIFVFMHQPIWVEAYRTDWLADVHPLLKTYPVKAVFAADQHLYRKDMVDDIPCFITGGAGAEGSGFYHFLHVSVKGDEVKIAVVKIGNIQSGDVVTGEVITTTQ